MAPATAGRKGGVPAASAGHRHSRPWQRVCRHSHWGNWEELGKPESSLQATFQKSICFLSFEIHFLCFLNTFKIPNKHQIIKKKDNKKQHFSLPVNRTATYAESLPHSPSNPQIQHAAQPPSNRIEHEAVHCLLS